jgi:hypothetical protein
MLQTLGFASRDVRFAPDPLLVCEPAQNDVSLSLPIVDLDVVQQA